MISLNEGEFCNSNKGFNDCFFCLKGNCYHIEHFSKTCEGKECIYYKSCLPLKKQQRNIFYDRTTASVDMNLTARRKREK